MRDWAAQGVFLLILNFFVCSYALTNEFYVSPNGNGTECSQGAPCASIKAGVSAACTSQNETPSISASTVWVTDGIYVMEEEIDISCINTLNIQ